MINVKINSKKVEKGDTFVAIKGFNVDGHTFINDAINNGATSVVVDHDVEVPDYVTKIIVDDTAKWLDEYVVNTYSDEVNKLKIIGITGTNGKTTTAYLTYQMLNELGASASYIGTIGYYSADGSSIELPNTTPNILDLYDLLLTGLNNGDEYAVMEVSSQGLDMGRTKGLKFSTALFTNLTQDHLDYHGDMQTYLKAKLKIVDQLDGVMITNKDDRYSGAFEEIASKSFNFGATGDLKVASYRDTKTGTYLILEYNDEVYEVETNLKGKFNVYNYLSCVSIMLNNGYSMESIIDATKNIYPPKGRCEQVSVRDGLAIIDYAHTPDAVEKIISTFNNDSYNRIITVVGCGGDRDPMKRPIMGNIATANSNFVVFTNDNPRTEDEKKIMTDILIGVVDDNYTVIHDRGEAINYALDMIEAGDVVLILGKGHEDYQIIGREKHHFDDKEVVMDYLKKNKVKVRKI